ncbi:MAG: sigma-70 family RNA polymerase sigma factor [Defluviitaleaceae bacterium]|nr:sigma-70 family RNA polymerase sigma factor [Defluviitaleaceae bacterium]
MGEATSTRIANAAKSIYTYCRNRTSTREEAEDLSQDILLELLKSQGCLRDEKAFYGFMWAVAGNVYKNWCKKRKSLMCELDDNAPDNSILFTEMLEKESDIRRLQRELKLLPEQYRKVVVMYYFDGMKVAAIAKRTNITESMVKFLLFKSRKILKEGINMGRTFGEQSFNPARMTLGFFAPKGNWSTWVDPAYFERNILAQNILLNCYNSPCTAEEISLQLGIAFPYLEKDLQELCDAAVLAKKSNRYETDIVIFTKEFNKELLAKTASHQKEIADVVTNFLDEKLAEFKKIGFFTGDMGDDSLLRWRITHLILEQSVINELDKKPNIEFTKEHNGNPIFFFGSEGAEYNCLAIDYDNKQGDKIQFLEFLPKTWLEIFSWGHFWNRDKRVKLMLEIAKGKMGGFDESEKTEIAELVKLGFLKKDNDKINLCIPIYAAAEYEQALTVTAEARGKISEITDKMIEISKDILVQHSPASKKKEAESIAWLKKREFSMDRPVEIMLGSGALRRTSETEHPAAYVVLK